jgi:hypothetical protein
MLRTFLFSISEQEMFKIIIRIFPNQIKYPEWTKASTAARQFDIELSTARGRKL